MYTKFIPKKIQEKLKAKERALAFKTRNINQAAFDTAISAEEIQSRAIFVRMCSNKRDVNNILISGGRRSEEDGKIKFGVSLDGSGAYNKNEASNYEFANTINANAQIRPGAGIKNIEVSYKGSYKAIREATINWVVGGVEELDELTPYFLTVGKTVVLDWGWVNVNTKDIIKDFGANPFITYVDGKYIVDQSIFSDAQSRIQEIGGDYDAIGGKVSNFEMTMRADGGFDCVTKITALGSTLFTKPVDKATNQISVIPRLSVSGSIATTTKEDNIINGLINIKQILKKNVFGAYPEGAFTTKAKGIKVKDNWFWQSDDVYIQTMKWNNVKIRNDDVYKTKHVLYLSYGDKHEYGMLVDDKKNPQVCLINWDGVEGYYVKWGYMEDQIFSRYLSYDAGSEDGAGIKITFRSIRTKINKDGNAIDNGNYKNSLNNTTAAAGAGGSVQGPPASDEYIVKPGDSLSKIAQNNGVNLDSLVQENLEILLPIDNEGDIDTEIFSDIPDDFDETSPVGGAKLSESEFVPAANYGSLNLQPGQKLNIEYATVSTSMADDVESEDANEGFSLNDLGSDNNIPYKDKIDAANTFKYEKESVLIKNNKEILHPINPTKFWSSELMAPVSRINFPYTNDENQTEQEKTYKEWSTSKVLNNENQIFTVKGKNNLGILRNMWVNVEEIQKAFGIDLNSSSQKVTPKGTFELAIKALLQSLNNNFYDIWNFELAVDPYDSTNMGVMDKKANSLDGVSLNYTTYQDNIGDGSIIDDRAGNFSHLIKKLGIYKFPSFKVGSIVKSQNLSFKIPNSMALTIMYGSNKPSSKDETKTKKAGHIAGFNNPELMKLFNNDSGKEYADKYLSDMVALTNIKGDEKKAQKVGSENTSEQSKIIRNTGLDIDPSEPWYKQYEGNTGKIKETINEININQEVKYVFLKGNAGIVLLKEKTETINFNQLSKDDKKSVPIRGNINTNSANEVQAVTPNTRGKFNVFKSLPKYYTIDKLKSFQMEPAVSSLIRSRLNGTLAREDEDLLKVDTIIPAELTLEIDGIGGLSPGDAVHTHYIQKKYEVNIVNDQKSFGPYTYFMIKGLSQKVDADGWITEITNVMRINHIPNRDDLRADLADGKIRKEIAAPPKRPVIPVPSDLSLPYIGDEIDVDDLDFDDLDFSSWPTPDPPPVYDRSTVDQPEPSLPVDDEPAAPMPAEQFNQYEDITRPKITVPMEESDIAKDAILDELFFEDFEWTAPPPKKDYRKIEQFGNAINLKITPPEPLKDVYIGSFEQNKVLYSVREDWRVLYEKPQGLANSSGIDKLSGAKQSFNPKQYKTEDNGTTTNPALAKVPASENERYNMVRSAQTKQIRSDFWHEYIEERNESGVSAFVTDKTLGTTGGPAFSFFNTEQLLNDGLVRDNRDIYWLGEYNPTFNNSDN